MVNGCAAHSSRRVLTRHLKICSLITLFTSKKRVGIAALKADRVTWVPKWVDPGNLRERTESEDYR